MPLDFGAMADAFRYAMCNLEKALASFNSTSISKVIFNDPATIIIWDDGTKTVVKVHNEPFDKEKGLCMAIMKKVLGDKYHRFFKEMCDGNPNRFTRKGTRNREDSRGV